MDDYLKEIEALNQLVSTIIGAAIEVHKALGPGLLESTYETCLVAELKQRKLRAERQKAVRIIYKSMVLEKGYCLDLLVEGRIVVEVKAAPFLGSIHKAQLRSYLKHSRCKVGLLINFNVVLLKEGLCRVNRFANQDNVTSSKAYLK